jgi:EAL domain-containing protein (putative c-di-GMP-specific phosphodiesterase class I)
MAHTQVPIMRAIVTLANELELTVIAEGVETIEEVERLQALGCHLAQGYAFGAAMTGAELGKRLTAQFSGK